MSLEGSRACGSRDFPIPTHRAAERWHSGAGLVTGNGMNEIAVSFNGAGFKICIEVGVALGKNAGNRAAGRRRFKIAGRKRKHTSVVIIFEHPIATDRYVACGNLGGAVPVHSAGYFKMLERASPCFDGIS